MRERLGASVEGGGRLQVTIGSNTATLHPVWLRERSTEEGALDPTNLQRLYDNNDLDLALEVVNCITDADVVRIEFSDGYQMSISAQRLMLELGWVPDLEALPDRVAWTSSLDPFPYVEWPRLAADDTEGIADALQKFWSLGFFVLRNVPTELDTIRKVATRLGNLIPTNFGEVFNVVSEADPTDLAYTPIHLNAHSDGPYRKPVPSIQMLHCLQNDTSGGESTLVDGFGASQELKAVDSEAYRALTETAVEFRYDMLSDVVINRTRILELDHVGRFRQIRFSHRLDYVDAVDPDQLDTFYRGRKWLRDRMNNPANQVQFRLAAGDLMLMDNHRLLHGRTSFDPREGRRHLQGCYIDHDGPDAMWRLAQRAIHGTSGSISPGA